MLLSYLQQDGRTGHPARAGGAPQDPIYQAPLRRAGFTRHSRPRGRSLGAERRRGALSNEQARVVRSRDLGFSPRPLQGFDCPASADRRPSRLGATGTGDPAGPEC
ncbi:phosphatidylinositol N-acetylglucosaminyltransferase subunit Y isoform X1 [Peromyscus maniculatus bairdii]|uniref:phosphatidylinositol N-acetylglucosaminyltransferase subunit Y isoform X1 n=1 Tax=Peromyscus maniculatus bairdii TaxID=230844 RepID=UPI003FD539F1